MKTKMKNKGRDIVAHRQPRQSQGRKAGHRQSVAKSTDFESLIEAQIEALENFLEGGGDTKRRKQGPRISAGDGFSVGHQKHLYGEVASSALHRPMYEDAFFQDAALDTAFMNLLIQPRNSIVNMIPVRPNNNLEQKFGFLTAHAVFDGEDSASEPESGCEPCVVVDDAYDFLKFSFPYGRICRRGKTLETNELIRRAALRQYDDFYFIGDLRGISAFQPPWENVQTDRDIIVQTAVNRQLWNIGRRLQLWMMDKVWSGDPTNNVGTAYKEFHGLLRLISDSYGTISSPITVEVMDESARATALNSHIVDFAGDCVGAGGRSLYEYLEEMEFVLYHRAEMLNMLPVDWGIFMPSFMWDEITKHLPCEMAGTGCGLPANTAVTQTNLVLNTPGGDLFTLSMREQMRKSRTLTLNGHTYPIYTDDSLPYTYDDLTNSYTADIFFVPFTANGIEVLYWEHMDYSELGQELSPLPGSFTDALGWTDGGRYHHAFTMERWCFEVQTKMEVRLIFKAPHLAGRLENVCVNIMSDGVRELWKNGAGLLTGQLVKNPALAPNGGSSGA